MSERRGCGILFYRLVDRAVLLFRRDADPAIPFPNQLDILGGLVEEGETPEQGVVREMAEELDDLRTGAPYVLRDFELFKSYQDERGTEQFIFCKEADFALPHLRLKEGQELVWVRPEEVDKEPVAFGFQEVIREFQATLA